MAVRSKQAVARQLKGTFTQRFLTDGLRDVDMGFMPISPRGTIVATPSITVTDHPLFRSDRTIIITSSSIRIGDARLISPAFSRQELDIHNLYKELVNLRNEHGEGPVFARAVDDRLKAFAKLVRKNPERINFTTDLPPIHDSKTAGTKR